MLCFDLLSYHLVITFIEDSSQSQVHQLKPHITLPPPPANSVS